MMKIASRLTLMHLVLFTLAGCQAGRTFVISPPPAATTPNPPARFQSVRIMEGVSTAELDHEYKDHFVNALREDLPQGVLLVPSSSPQDDLVITYRFIQYDPGAGPVRVGAAIVSLIGVPTGSLGTGDLAIDVVYSTANGKELAHVVVNGPIDGPTASTSTGLDTAAKSIADFAQQHFLIATNEPPEQD